MAHEDNRSKALAKKAKASAASYTGKKYKSKDTIVKEVSSALGLTTVPNTPPPGTKWGKEDSATSTYAANLTGKDKWYYGEEASALTNKAIADSAASSGYYATDSQGNIIVSKTTGDPLLTSKGYELKYGKSGGAMGSGDPTGAMTSIPISKEMLQTQNKVISAVTGVLGAVSPGVGATVLKLTSAQASKDAYLTPGKAYDTYQEKFKKKQAGKEFTSTRNVLGVLGLQHEKKTLGQ